MVRRLAPFLFSLSIILAAFAAPASADGSEGVSFTVPESPAGEVSATATAPVDAAPYLRVRLTSAAATPLVANSGPDTTIPVETWGLSGDRTFTLQGCTGQDPGTCTDLASVSRTVTQTAALTATIDAPEDFFYWPESPVVVTAHNDGGGVVHAFAGSGNVGARVDQVLGQDTPADFDLAGVVVAGPGSAALVSVQRCSAYSPTLCEPASATRAIHFLGTPETHLVAQPNPATVVTDPALRHAPLTVRDYGPAISGVAFTTTWSIEDAAGHTVVGPIDAGVATRLTHLDVDPSAEPGGAMLDGSYTLRVRNTVQAPTGPHTGESTHPITLVASPPVVAPPTPTTVKNRLYDVNDVASWTVPAVGNDWAVRASITITNRRDKVVYSGRSTSSDDDALCDGAVCTSSMTAAEQASAHFEMTWFGDNNDRVHVAGRFTAEATIPDSYGRPVSVPLGAVYVYKAVDHTVRRTVRMTAPRTLTKGQLAAYTIRLPRISGDPRIESIEVGARLKSADRRAEHDLPQAHLPRATMAIHVATTRRWLKETLQPWNEWTSFAQPFWSLHGRRLPDKATTVRVRITNRSQDPLTVQAFRVVVEYWRWSLT